MEIQEETKINSRLVVVFTSLLIGLSILLYIYYEKIFYFEMGGNLSSQEGLNVYRDMNTARGAFGDFFGGILNPLFSFVSILLVVNELRLQRKEFEMNRNANKISLSKTLEDQNLTRRVHEESIATNLQIASDNRKANKENQIKIERSTDITNYMAKVDRFFTTLNLLNFSGYKGISALNYIVSSGKSINQFDRDAGPIFVSLLMMVEELLEEALLDGLDANNIEDTYLKGFIYGEFKIRFSRALTMLIFDSYKKYEKSNSMKGVVVDFALKLSQHYKMKDSLPELHDVKAINELFS